MNPEQPQAFDRYALQYDQHFTHSPIGRLQRAQVYRALLNYLPSQHKKVLELNCGTGEDAVWLAGQGLQVLATDISEGMLTVAKQKSSAKEVVFKQLKSQDIDQLMPGQYDLIFSNFGGLNCLAPEELDALAYTCYALQPAKSRLAFVIMSNNCLWEKWYFRFRKQEDNATRRFNKSGTDTMIDGVRFRTYYYHPGEIEERFASHYTVLIKRPIGLFVPPTYMNGYFYKHPLLLKSLALLDHIFGRFSFLSNAADHYIIVLEKKDTISNFINT